MEDREGEYEIVEDERQVLYEALVDSHQVPNNYQQLQSSTKDAHSIKMSVPNTSKRCLAAIVFLMVLLLLATMAAIALSLSNHVAFVNDNSQLQLCQSVSGEMQM